MSEESCQALKYFFGFEQFLDNQEQIVDKVVAGQDLGVVMPTGAGKSICYQLPALMRSGYTIVVSPLISLMKDQVDALHRRGIAAACINSAVSSREQSDIFNELENGMLKLLYVAPERFDSTVFKRIMQSTPPTALVVDEAHCISQWGHDFRPAYMRIGQFIEEHNINQICAFTATATTQVRDDIIQQLHRPNMEMLVAGFKRPNLAFSVKECPKKEQKEAFIAKLLETQMTTIIYTSTRKNVEEIAQKFKCIAYHAGMSDEDRALAQDRFMNDKAPVLVATNAFGMGIDRADVRRVIHYNIPGSLEAYYQEAGRAGRDGEPAECILLFAYSDKFVQEFLIDMSNPPPEACHSTWSTLRRLARERQSNALEVTGSELAEMVSDAKNDQMVSTIMGILERHGYIERTFRGANAGSIRVVGDLDVLANEHAAEATQRSRFISRVIRHYGASIRDFQSCTYSDLANIAGLNEEQLKRVLRALHGLQIEWNPPFSGRGTLLLRPEDKSLAIDFRELEEKHRFERSRLDEVIGYTRTRGCRQRFMIEYFGESSQSWRCESCDLCLTGRSLGVELREPNSQELDIIRTILCAVDYFGGRLGGGKISLILAGAKRSEILDRRLDRNSFFGKLIKLKQSKIMDIMRSMESAGLLCKCGSMEYPCMDLTAKGAEVASGATVPTLEMPDLGLNRVAKVQAQPKEEKVAKSKKTVDLDEETAQLFEEMRSLRAQLAAERKVPPYVILHDSMILDLIALRPKTPQEATAVKGIGPAKLVTVIPHFLEILNR